MRKYRARKALREAVERALRQDLDAAAIVAEHLETLRLERELRRMVKGEPVTPIGVTPEAER